ncbi:MAG: hypothetical protein J0M04_23540 [Verrucomicrobia bacterium]|nr:hypothetical protein [Verrucomicrobiota bacterium]
MLTRREKAIVAAVPTGIVLVVVWVLWLWPRLVFHGIAAGDWSDFSGIRHTQVGEDSVISFRARSGEVLQDMIGRLEFRRGVPGGNTHLTSEAAMRSAGYDPNRFNKYFSSGRWVIFLYVGNDECVMVKINL